nr:bifunctional (p)ppGpp synthetase/guanosine-3',5'-bis(diphosphate) 3'-pyrophosphohydrolase [Agilicoccus flavus]
MRARLARFGAPRNATNPTIEPLLRTVRANHPKADLGVIERAYALAERVHDGQMRKSGDAYITHPLSVANILAEIGMPPTTLAAALLHDTVEDTSYALDDLRRDFGDEIAILVDGVTKLDKVEYGDAAQAETVRKMILAVSRHVHVLLIKLADRLHNARTWRYVSPASAQRKAKETLEIYAPLAHRLGLNTIKWELEDLSFQTLYPKVYDEIVRLVADRAPEREEELAVVKAAIVADLKEAGITANVSGRPKHYYSVYQKMIVRGRDFEDIHDLVAVRVLVDSVRDCYSVLGSMHARFRPMPGRFKDYIASPKFNMYQSLHTTVIGPGGKPIEIQIRTKDMHHRAEYGVAAHWKYKDLAGGKGADPLDELSWLRQILDWQRETEDPKEFLDSLRFEINAKEVFAFTPKGGAITLPKGSTPIDFAYAVHTEVGHYCIGARVNGRLVPLHTVLDNGDQVEILTSRADGAGPSRDWLDIARSPRALSKIRQWFSKERREESIERGKEAIVKAMRRRNLPLTRLMTAERLTDLAASWHYTDVDALYAAVGEKHLSAQAFIDRLVASYGGEEGATEDLAEATVPGRRQAVRSAGDPGIVIGDGVTGVWSKLAQCCTPVPGDDIIGFTTRSQGVSVHRRNCVNAELLQEHPERLVDVSWAEGSENVADGRSFRVQVQIVGLNRKSLLADITKALADERIDIITANVATKTDRQARSTFVFDMGDPSHLEHVLRTLRAVDHVIEVERVTGDRPRSRPGHRAVADRAGA